MADRDRKGKGRAVDAYQPTDLIRSNSTSSIELTFEIYEWSGPSANIRRDPVDWLYRLVNRPEPTDTRSSKSGRRLPSKIVEGLDLLLPPTKKDKPNDAVRQVEGMKSWFDGRRFDKTLEVEVAGFNDFNFGPRTETDLCLLLVHAAKTVQRTIQAHKNKLVEGGIERDVVDHETTIEYFDLDDLTGRDDVIPRKFLDSEDLRYLDVSKRTIPTIAMLGILKTKIPKFPLKPELVSEARRHEMLRYWIDSWARWQMAKLPLKLYQPHFKKRDINYAAVYAKTRYNEAMLTYRDMWHRWEKVGSAIKLAVREWGCPHPDELVERHLIPNEVMDFNNFNDPDLMRLDWQPRQVGFPLIPDPITPQMELRCRNFRYSIALFAFNTRTVEAWSTDLQYAYDEYQHRETHRERDELKRIEAMR